MTPDEAVARLRMFAGDGVIWKSEATAIADLIEYAPREMRGEDITDPDKWEWWKHIEQRWLPLPEAVPQNDYVYIVRKKRSLSPEQKFREELEELRDVYSGEHTCVRIDTAVNAARKAGLL